MRSHHILPQLLIALALAPSLTRACSCTPPPPAQEAFASADYVIAGAIIDIAEPPLSPMAWVNGDTIMVSRSNDMRSYRVLVHECWKGAVEGDTLIVFSEQESASCGYEFRKDHDYLIYGDLVDPTGERWAERGWAIPPPNPAHTASLCSRTGPFEERWADVPQLDQLRTLLEKGERGTIRHGIETAHPDRSQDVQSEDSPPRVVDYNDACRTGFFFLAGASGTIVLDVELTAKGKLRQTSIADRSHPLMEHEAQVIARHCEYAPAIRAGRPIESEMSLELSFEWEYASADQPRFKESPTLRGSTIVRDRASESKASVVHGHDPKIWTYDGVDFIGDLPLDCYETVSKVMVSVLMQGETIAQIRTVFVRNPVAALGRDDELEIQVVTQVREVPAVRHGHGRFFRLKESGGKISLVRERGDWLK